MLTTSYKLRVLRGIYSVCLFACPTASSTEATHVLDEGKWKLWWASLVLITHHRTCGLSPWSVIWLQILAKVGLLPKCPAFPRLLQPVIWQFHKALSNHVWPNIDQAKASVSKLSSPMSFHGPTVLMLKPGVTESSEQLKKPNNCRPRCHRVSAYLLALRQGALRTPSLFSHLYSGDHTACSNQPGCVKTPEKYIGIIVLSQLLLFLVYLSILHLFSNYQHLLKKVSKEEL